jgi:hypothetical protein
VVVHCSSRLGLRRRQSAALVKRRGTSAPDTQDASQAVSTTAISNAMAAQKQHLINMQRQHHQAPHGAPDRPTGERRAAHSEHTDQDATATDT